MGTYGVQIKGAPPWLVRWARRAGTKDFYPCLAVLTAHYFTLCVPIAQQPEQAAVLSRLSLNVSLHIPLSILSKKY
jgi:hypothetical protein